ncbi:MAG: hypothetical protein KAS93_03090 [Gammaproteobacteria bacterium]|nr:hypothetical protein [Gammaproteobacteria bacterium]
MTKQSFFGEAPSAPQSSTKAEKRPTNSGGGSTSPISIPNSPRRVEDEWGPYGPDSDDQSGRLIGSGSSKGVPGKNGMAP